MPSPGALWIVEFGTGIAGTLAHARHAARGLPLLWRANALSVVLDSEDDVVVAPTQVHADSAPMAMLKRIVQGLHSDAEELLLRLAGNGAPVQR